MYSKVTEYWAGPGNKAKELPCQHENGNRVNSFAVAVVRGEAIVGHVPKKISVCSLYLMLGWLDCLSSNRIQMLLWEFSARLSLLLSISNCSVRCSSC